MNSAPRNGAAAGALVTPTTAEREAGCAASVDETALQCKRSQVRAMRAYDKFSWLLRQTGTVAEMSLLQAFVIACHHKDTTLNDDRVFPPFHVWLSSAEIARRSGLNERTIPAVIARLKQRGLIESAGRYGKTGQIRVFRLLIDATATPQVPAPFEDAETPQESTPLTEGETPQVPASKACMFLHETLQVPASAYIEVKRELKRELKREKTRVSAKPRKAGRVKSDELTFTEWHVRWTASKTEGERFLPDDDPLHTWATESGISYDFLVLAYLWFKEHHIQDAPGKKQKDWRATFRKYVREDWCHLWTCRDGVYRLNAKGKACAIRHGEDPEMTSSASRDWTSNST